jgi:homoserine dehydrogenase
MRIVLIGFGTVAQGLAELLLSHLENGALDISDWRVVGISDTLKGSAYHEGGLPLRRVLDMVGCGQSLSSVADWGTPWNALTMIEHADADVVVEATYTDIETARPALDHVRAAIERGMHVATTNKGPLALAAKELTKLAAEHHVSLRYEGTVMAGTPLLNLIRGPLAGSRITEMRGILNGTTNYVLSRMEEGLDYSGALAEAQELGYAEAVPNADVLGHDALAKVAILAATVFGASIPLAEIPCRGITGITREKVARAAASGRRHKLLGRVWRENDRVRASVGPELIGREHPLAAVHGAGNAMTVVTEALGEVTIVGPGAGRRETGFALLNDLIHIQNHR